MSPKTPASQDRLLEEVDTFEAALDETSQVLAKNHEMLLEVNHKLDALLKHFDVPYKPPAGFIKG